MWGPLSVLNRALLRVSSRRRVRLSPLSRPTALPRGQRAKDTSCSYNPWCRCVHYEGPSPATVELERGCIPIFWEGLEHCERRVGVPCLIVFRPDPANRLTPSPVFWTTISYGGQWEQVVNSMQYIVGSYVNPPTSRAAHNIWRPFRL